MLLSIYFLPLQSLNQFVPCLEHLMELFTTWQLKQFAHHIAPAFLLLHIVKHAGLHFLFILCIMQCFHSINLHLHLIVEPVITLQSGLIILSN